MNLFQLVLKNMRQRMLSTSLTMLSVVLGVALAVGIMVLRRESESLFGQKDFGYEVLVGPPKGSPLQLTLNSVYHIDQSPGVIPYAVYEDMTRPIGAAVPEGRSDYRQFVKLAIPMVVGDSVNGKRLIGTTPQMFGFDDNGQPVPETDRFQYRKGRSYQFAQGRAFGARKFEAVIGADAARELNLRLYDPKQSAQQNLKSGGAIQVTHGMPGPNDTPDVHKPIWRVVGILEPTGTANDKVVFVPFISTYAISEHEDGMIEQSLMRAKLDVTKLPVSQREAALREVGLDPKKMSDDLRAKLGLGGSARPAPTGGELMQGDAPKKGHDDHDHDHDHPPATKAAGHDDHDDDHDHPPTTKAAAHDDHDHDHAPATAATMADAHDDHGDHDGHDHDHDEDAFTLDANGNITPNLPQDRWALSAIFVKVRGGAFGGFNTTMLNYNFKVIDDRATAVSPASVMREFFDTFLKGSANVLLAISVLVTVVAGASIATTIYNSVAGRLREIAILRALGATRGKILALICAEAGLIGAAGGVVGLILGHALTGIASGYFKRTIGEDINWLKVDSLEWMYLTAVVVLSLLAGLVPALKAYRTPVATNLTNA